jgi:hypothetical protein
MITGTSYEQRILKSEVRLNAGHRVPDGLFGGS